MDNKTARQDLETVIRVEDLALGSMRKLRAIQDWLRAEAAITNQPAQTSLTSLIPAIVELAGQNDPHGCGIDKDQFMEQLNKLAAQPFPPTSAGIDQKADSFPVSHTCPECGCSMTEANPANSERDVWYCSECGFNEPEGDCYE